MRETSMILASTSQAPAQGPTQTLTIQQSQAPVSSGYIAIEHSMFPVRVKTSDA